MVTGCCEKPGLQDAPQRHSAISHSATIFTADHIPVRRWYQKSNRPRISKQHSELRRYLRRKRLQLLSLSLWWWSLSGPATGTAVVPRRVGVTVLPGYDTVGYDKSVYFPCGAKSFNYLHSRACSFYRSDRNIRNFGFRFKAFSSLGESGYLPVMEVIGPQPLRAARKVWSNSRKAGM